LPMRAVVDGDEASDASPAVLTDVVVLALGDDGADVSLFNDALPLRGVAIP
jgi:hypothetical protein